MSLSIKSTLYCSKSGWCVPLSIHLLLIIVMRSRSIYILLVRWAITSSLYSEQLLMLLLQATKISVHFLIVSHTLKFRLYIPFYVAILSTPLALAYSKDLPHENTVTLTKTATFFALMCMATSIRDLHLFIYCFYCHSQKILDLRV